MMRNGTTQVATPSRMSSRPTPRSRFAAPRSPERAAHAARPHHARAGWSTCRRRCSTTRARGSTPPTARPAPSQVPGSRVGVRRSTFPSDLQLHHAPRRDQGPTFGLWAALRAREERRSRRLVCGLEASAFPAAWPRSTGRQSKRDGRISRLRSVTIATWTTWSRLRANWSGLTPR